ncbi:MAG: BMP family ABC transporter substrate-binding protein [Lachnospiraceae bacterium]|nr:BMP family ABC transporter substrate-binding protein [Lachnospiraceae bacterium]
MKKGICLVLVLSLVLSLCACSSGNSGSSGGSGDSGSSKSDYKVAMITDSGDITDQSFNQTTYEACKAFCDKNGIKFTYKKPAGDSTAERASAVESAIDEGYNIVVMPGFSFGATIVDLSEKYTDVKFIGLDLSAGDILEAGVPKKGGTYDYNPANWNVKDYYHYENVYLACYQEQYSGYMAGYAAVKLGYTKLGYLGGMAVPGPMKYGYGYVQGADAAAKELGINVDMKFAYANKFVGDADITAAMDTWYGAGTEIVFACGAGIYTSVAEAAGKAKGKVIGVDVDQKSIIDGMYGSGMTVTSALKGLYPSTYDALDDIVNKGKWSEYSGQIKSLGLISGDDPDANYVSLPMESTQFSDKFTKEDYKVVVKGMFDGTIKVSDDLSKEPSTTNVKVEWLGNLK